MVAKTVREVQVSATAGRLQFDRRAERSPQPVFDLRRGDQDHFSAPAHEGDELGELVDTQIDEFIAFQMEGSAMRVVSEVHDRCARMTFVQLRRLDVDGT